MIIHHSGAKNNIKQNVNNKDHDSSHYSQGLYFCFNNDTETQPILEKPFKNNKLMHHNITGRSILFLLYVHSLNTCYISFL